MASNAPPQQQQQQATGAAPNAGRPAARGPVVVPNAANATFASGSLYVGDLHPEVTDALLYQIFESVGPIVSVRVCRDRVTRRSLGYAYVNFQSNADAERSLDTMNYTPIRGKPCRIMWSQRDPSLRKSGVGNVFVRNLDSSIENKALYDTFSLFGNILSCKVAQKPNGESKGYGYVHYETAEAAQDAIAKINGMLLANKEVYVGDFKKRTDRSNTDVWTNCYVKNIPDSWDEETLIERFSKFGETKSAVIMREKSDEAEGNSKGLGYGFVNFATTEAATAAVEGLNNLVFHEDGEEKKLYVGRAQKKEDRARDLRAKFELIKRERYAGVNLFVKNLDDSIDDAKLREEFEPFGTITSARVMKDTSDRSRGFGFVCFSSTEEAQSAVENMHHKSMAGKPIYVALAQSKEVRRQQLEAAHSNGYMQGDRRANAAPNAMMQFSQQMYYHQQHMHGPPGGRHVIYPQHNPQHNMMSGMRRQPPPMFHPMPYMPQYPQQMAPQGGPQQKNSRKAQKNAARGANRQGGQAPPGQQQGNVNFKNNVRNPPQNVHNAQIQNNAQMQAAAHHAQQAQAPPAQLALPELASATPEQQKNMIGEKLYPLIYAKEPSLCGKITGMLLEMDNGELLHLIESPEALSAKIKEALDVLREHNPAE